MTCYLDHQWKVAARIGGLLIIFLATMPLFTFLITAMMICCRPRGVPPQSEIVGFSLLAFEENKILFEQFENAILANHHGLQGGFKNGVFIV